MYHVIINNLAFHRVHTELYYYFCYYYNYYYSELQPFQGIVLCGEDLTLFVTMQLFLMKGIGIKL